MVVYSALVRSSTDIFDDGGFIKLGGGLACLLPDVEDVTFQCERPMSVMAPSDGLSCALPRGIEADSCRLEVQGPCSCAVCKNSDSFSYLRSPSFSYTGNVVVSCLRDNVDSQRINAARQKSSKTAQPQRIASFLGRTNCCVIHVGTE